MELIRNKKGYQLKILLEVVTEKIFPVPIFKQFLRAILCVPGVAC